MSYLYLDPQLTLVFCATPSLICTILANSVLCKQLDPLVLAQFFSSSTSIFTINKTTVAQDTSW